MLAWVLYYPSSSRLCAICVVLLVEVPFLQLVLWLVVLMYMIAYLDMWERQDYHVYYAFTCYSSDLNDDIWVRVLMPPCAKVTLCLLCIRFRWALCGRLQEFNRICKLVWGVAFIIKGGRVLTGTSKWVRVSQILRMTTTNVRISYLCGLLTRAK